MRYINKEYGFEFRPPHFDKFYEESSSGQVLSKDNFPPHIIRGAGFDYSAINGAMLVGKNGTMWGVRVSCFLKGRWLDNDDFILNMNASSANTADGTFAHFASGFLSAKWVSHGDNGMILQLSSRKKLRVRVIFYPCFDLSGDLSIEGSVVKGRSPYIGIIKGNTSLGDTSAVFKNRYAVICDTNEDKEYFYAKSYSQPSDSANGAFNEAIMDFMLGKWQQSVFIYASVGGESLLSGENSPNIEEVKDAVDTAELMYGVNKTMGTGVLGSSVERMLNSVLWSRIYYPYLLSPIFAPSRTKLNKHFDISGTEENCSTILASLIFDATSQLHITLEDKIMAVLAVWNAYARGGDKQVVLGLYNKLLSLYEAESSLVIDSGDNKSVAYRWEDSPLKEADGRALYSLDLSCLKLLAFDILERLCIVFDNGSEAENYGKIKVELSNAINETLYNEATGLYQNRFVVSGEFSDKIGATSFYPLIAGAVVCPVRLQRLVDQLTNKKLFWTKFAVPTLNVKDKEFSKKGKYDNNGKRSPAFLEYRGSIIPYVNYIIYMGLARCGLEEVAGELALKSCKLWSNNENNNVENYSMYLPSGKRYKQREYLSSNGNMLAMIGLLELIDIEMFRPDTDTNAIRFGTFCEGIHSVSNVKILGKSYSLEVLEDSTALLEDEIPIFRGDGGRFVVRDFMQTDLGFEFLLNTKSEISITLLGMNDDTPTRFKAPEGKSFIEIVDRKVSITRFE